MAEAVAVLTVDLLRRATRELRVEPAEYYIIDPFPPHDVMLAQEMQRRIDAAIIADINKHSAET